MRKTALLLFFTALISSAPLSAQTLYAATGSNSVNGVLYVINPATAGIVSTVGNITVSGSPIGITGLAFNPINGTLFGVTTGGSPNFHRSLVTINPSTGAATLVGSSGGLGSVVGDITFDGSGVLYGWQGGGDGSPTHLVTINQSTGVTTTIGSDVIAAGGLGLSFGTVSPFTLFLSIDGDDGTLRTVNKTTGVTTIGPSLTGSPEDGGVFGAMAANNAGTLFASDTNQSGSPTDVHLVTVNTTTGAVTDIGALPGDTDAIAFQVVSGAPPPTTPIPNTSLLVIIGLACLALYQFRGKFTARKSGSDLT